MRTLFKIIIALVVLVVTFGIYWWAQPSMHVQPAVVVPTGPAAIRPLPGAQPLAGMGPGDSVWVKQYDNFGKISYQFKADEYLPQGGGNVHVTQPRTVFFLKSARKRSRLELDGVNGNIVVDSAMDAPKDGIVKKESMGHGAMQPPRSGKLYDVTIRMYDDENTDPKYPTLTMKTNNIAFDNETFRIYTDAYTDLRTGEQIPADRVRVDVTGTYDIVGYGLTVRWNDLDQRLELLKIHHGESLKINDPSALSGGPLGSKKLASADESDGPDAAISGAESAGLPNALKPAAPTSTRRNITLVDDPAAKPKKSKKDKSAKLNDGTTTPAPTPKTTPKAASKTPTTKMVKPPQPPYHAVFHDDVVVKQGTETLAVADVMNVDFLMDSGKRAPGASTRPSTAPALAGTTSTRPTTAASLPEPDAATILSPAKVATANPTTEPAATTKPAQEPIIVYWHGPLIMTPAAVPAELALKPGETVLGFVGLPAVLTRDGSEAKCATATYRSADGLMVLRSSEQFPRVLIRQDAKDAKADAPPSTISTEWAEYSLLAKIATLHGQSEAHLPIPSQKPTDAATQPAELAAAPVEMMEARWTEKASFHLTGESDRQMSIEHADFAGDVDIVHPQMKLKSQRLELAFDPSPAAKPVDHPGSDPTANAASSTLKHAIASQDVWCELADAKGKKQTINCDNLDLKTATSDEGKMYPQIVNATGKVKAHDDTQELTAGRVLLTLAPSTKLPQAAASPADAVADADNRAVSPAPLSTSQSVELRTMQATENVHVRSADGATAAADSLDVTADPGADGKTTVILLGAPARVVDASENVITGPRIVVHPRDSIATIEGAGTLDATQRAAAASGTEGNPSTRPAGDSKNSRPLHVTWQQNAIVSGPRNRIDAVGKVSATSSDADGTVNTAHGDRVVVVMVDKLLPGGTTKPSGAAATKPPVAPASAAATTKPADGLAGQFKMDLFKDKEVGSIVLLDKDRAIINSNLTAPDGTLLRETQLQATSMRFQPREGQMLVPVPGEMIVRDHRPDEKSTQPRPPGATSQPAGATTDASGRGDTAFKWKKSLAYDQTKRRAVMVGDVLIVHKPEAPTTKPVAPTGGAAASTPDEPVRVNADWVAADFEPQQAASRPATLPATDPTEPNALRLKLLTAVGNISVTRNTGQLLAQKIVFNPQSNWITATGSANNPATFADSVTGQTTTASEIWWNTVTWDVRFRNISARAVK